MKLQVGVMEFGTDANQDKPQQFFFFFFLKMQNIAYWGDSA